MGNLAATSGGPSPEFWPETVGSGGWATALVVMFLISWQLLRSVLPAARPKPVKPSSTPVAPTPASASQDGAPGALLGGVGGLISDADLVDLIREIEGRGDGAGGDALPWEDVIQKSNGRISYSAKCCRPKNGPVKYLSTTVFENCNTELLRDFYMDNEYRTKWDKTVLEHKQLEVDEAHAIEFGRTIKKFPLLTPREYVLGWRLWEGRNKTFYCLIKDCEHPLVPLQKKKYVRVGYFRSGWHISKVPGRDACEIRMVHQEDAGLNVEMAKLAFGKGIWSYVCKMDNALREYPSWVPVHSNTAALIPLKIIPVPHELENVSEEMPPAPHVADPSTVPDLTLLESPIRTSTKAWIAKSLVVVGGVICLSRGNATLATQLAMACFLKKLTKQGGDIDRDPAQDANRSRWPSKRIGWLKRSQSENHTLPKFVSSRSASFAL